MTWLGVPIFDWVLLVFVLGLGVEAWLTIRSPSDGDKTEVGTTTSRENTVQSAADEAGRDR